MYNLVTWSDRSMALRAHTISVKWVYRKKTKFIFRSFDYLNVLQKIRRHKQKCVLSTNKFIFWVVCTQSDFNNGRSNVPVLPDTGTVLAISTGAVLVPVLDDNALPVQAC